MAKKVKPTKNEREQEILDYKIAKAAEQIQFYMEHNLSVKKIEKLEDKKNRHEERKANL